MYNNSLVYHLNAAAFYQEKITGLNLTRDNSTYAEEIYVYVPLQDVESVGELLHQQGIKHNINQYELKELAGKTVCFFKRSELDTQQLEFLVSAVSKGARIESLLDYLDRRLHYSPVELLHSDYLLDKKVFRARASIFRRWQKSLMDMLITIALLLFTLPIWVLTALAIKVESPGPIFFRQRRTGLYNQEFDIIKFRSMREDAEKDGARWACKNDSRVTKVGNFIRKTRIDELPQLLNVLKGDMSLIGPRPEREVFIHDLEKHVPYYRFRHVVKPGITGLAQVKYTYGASIADAMHKHRHDIYYIKHQSLWMDIKILAYTVWIVITGRGL